MSRTNASLSPQNSTLRHPSLLKASNLPSFRRRDFQREALPSHKIDIVVEDAAQVHEIVRIDRLNCVAYLFLKNYQNCLKAIDFV